MIHTHADDDDFTRCTHASHTKMKKKTHTQLDINIQSRYESQRTEKSERERESVQQAIRLLSRKGDQYECTNALTRFVHRVCILINDDA